MKKEIEIFDKPENIKRLLMVFFAVLVGLIVADFFIHKHAYFPWEEYPSFFAAYGFVACVMVIAISKVLRFFLMRREDYYKGDE